MKTRSIATFALPVLGAASLAQPALPQAVDGAAARTEVAWAMSVTNKGIATIPTFTLGRPAAILDASVRRGGFSVSPQFRVGLDATPWTFLVWGRYRLLDGERLRVTVGAYPGLAFRSTTVLMNGSRREVVVARRSAAGELSPSYALSKNVSVGTYYQYSRGLDADMTRNTHFIAARAGLANLGLPARFVARLDPQLYYLRSDDRDGMYVNSRATLARRGLPVSVSGIVNRPIRTDVPHAGELLWNVSLTYSSRPTR